MTHPPIHRWPLPYEDRLAPRGLSDVDLVILHCTELPDLAMARDYGERVRYETGTGNSGHYYIDRDGAIHEFVSPDRIAHHCRGHNPHSIGIELVNSGRYPHWLDSRHQQMTEPYPDAQIDTLIALLRGLVSTIPTLRHIAGHEDLDTTREPASDDPSLQVRRKRDPGVMFPWGRVIGAGLLRFPPGHASHGA